MRKIILLLTSLILVSCGNFKYYNYVVVFENGDTIHVEAYTYRFNEYYKSVTFDDCWYKSIGSYTSVKEIKCE